jgi:hypothetical protein
LPGAALEELNLDGTCACDDDLALLAPLAGSLHRISVCGIGEAVDWLISEEGVQKAQAAFAQLGGAVEISYHHFWPGTS